MTQLSEVDSPAKADRNAAGSQAELSVFGGGQHTRHAGSNKYSPRGHEGHRVPAKPLGWAWGGERITGPPPSAEKPPGERMQARDEPGEARDRP